VISHTTEAPTRASTTRFQTGAEWWDALGHVPLARIVFDPWPGTATEQDVLRLDEHEDRLCELIDGTLVEKPMGFEESAIAAQIIFLLKTFVAPRNLGIVTAPDGMMRILADRVRTPDVAFVSLDRLPGGRVPATPIPELAPDLAVEVISPTDTHTGDPHTGTDARITQYLASGVRVVWIIDPWMRTVTVYEPDGAIQTTTAPTTVPASPGGQSLAMGFAALVVILPPLLLPAAVAVVALGAGSTSTAFTLEQERMIFSG